MGEHYKGFLSAMRVGGNCTLPAMENAVMHARGGVTGKLCVGAFSDRMVSPTPSHTAPKSGALLSHLFFEGGRYQPPQLHEAIVDAITSPLLNDLWVWGEVAGDRCQWQVDR